MPWWIWLVAGLILAAAEALTGDFTLFCVGLSAILVGLASCLGPFDIRAQVLAFAVLSAGSLFWAREWLRNHFLARGESREMSNVLGETAIPLDDLPAFGFGEAELRGTRWSAHNAGQVAILRGQRCRVMKVKGLTLWIMPE